MPQKNMLKKGWACLCVFCMLVSLLGGGVSAWADENVQQEEIAVPAAQEPQESLPPEDAEVPADSPSEAPDDPEETPPPETSQPAEEIIIEETPDPDDETASGAAEEDPAPDPEQETDEEAPLLPLQDADTPLPEDAGQGETEGDVNTVEEEEEPFSAPDEEAEQALDGDVLQMAVLQFRAPSSTDLADFLTRVVIDAPTDEQGNYLINPNNAYDLSFTFSERESLQFADEEEMVYTFPPGVLIDDMGPYTFLIDVRDEQGTATVAGNTFRVVNGQLRVRFNQDDPNFARLQAMPNTRFNIGLSSRFDETVGEIVFNAHIIKDFVYEEISDLSITKQVRYDQAADMAYYTLQITSEGKNDNVVIQDRITGTALIFQQDVTAESSVQGPLAPAVDYGAVENGFRAVLPSLAHGEVVTLRYSAAVDNTKITGRGTVEQTNNTARVLSDQVPGGKEASADFHDQVKFHKIGKTAMGDPVLLEDGTYEVTWRILVNQDHKLPVGGQKIYDWIRSDSRGYMTIANAPIIVNVTYEDGSTETRVVPLEELSLYQNSGGVYGWYYQTPETDGKAAYEIFCKTVVDTREALSDLKVYNSAQLAEWSYTEAATQFDYVGTDSLTAEKHAEGTTDTQSEWVIVVHVPRQGLPDLRVVDDMPRLEINGETYVDTYVEGSMTVEGLQGEENYLLYVSTTGRNYTVTFYTDAARTQTGLLPSADGGNRDIVIRFKTAVNQDWLSLAEENDYTQYHRHRNSMSVRVNSAIMASDDDAVTPIRPWMDKKTAGQGTVEIGGVSYPVFRYVLTMLGPTRDGVVITDTFDTDYLQYYPAEGVTILGGMNMSPTDGDGEASAADTADGMAITVHRFPKKADGSFYSVYQIGYSLIVRDGGALQALQEAAAAQPNGYILENTACWEGLASSAEAVYTYYPYVDKELLTRPTAENGYVAEFRVVINQYAQDLDPTSDVLDIQDILSSNLRLIPDSVAVSPALPGITVQHEDESNTLILTGVPDETRITLTYQARVLGSGETAYSNTVKMGRFEKTVQETAVITSSGGGAGSNPSITLVKRDASDLSSTLAGAVFQLFYEENGSRIPVTDSQGGYVTFTTGADGTVLIVGNLQGMGWALWEDRTYYLVEVQAPAGYEILVEPIPFVLTQNPASQMEFDLIGDQISVKNEPMTVSASVTKLWMGPAGGPVTVHLLADGVDTGRTATLDENSHWTATFEGLRKYDAMGQEIVYSVEEAPIIGYDPQYGGSLEGGFIITNFNVETMDIPVMKYWIGPAADRVSIHLLADGRVTQETVLTAEENWQYTFENLPRYDVTDGHAITYWIEEAGLAGYAPAVEKLDDGSFAITNTNIETLDIPVTKRWIGPAGDAATMILLADGTELDRVTLTAAEDWRHTFAALPKYDSADGHAIVYDVQELPVEGYTPGRSGTAETGFTFTNTITGKVSVPVTKRWIGPGAASALVYLLADGQRVDQVELNDAVAWQYTFADLPQYDAADGHAIQYTVEEEPVEGYALTIAGAMTEGFLLTNTNTETRDIPVQKTWVGTPLSAVTIRLLADRQAVDQATLQAASAWRHTFASLPRYDAADGHEIVYTVTEDEVPQYTPQIQGDMAQGFVVTNTQAAPPPHSDTPKTGDESRGMIYLWAMVLSGGGLVALLLAARKKKQ